MGKHNEPSDDGFIDTALGVEISPDTGDVMMTYRGRDGGVNEVGIAHDNFCEIVVAWRVNELQRVRSEKGSLQEWAAASVREMQLMQDVMNATGNYGGQ